MARWVHEALVQLPVLHKRNKKIFVEFKEFKVTILLELGVSYRGIAILSFIPFCIFKVFHNLKVYICRRFEESFGKSHSEILSTELTRRPAAIAERGVSS